MKLIHPSEMRKRATAAMESYESFKGLTSIKRGMIVAAMTKMALEIQNETASKALVDITEMVNDIRKVRKECETLVSSD